ncbi:MAG: SMC-Scp complex subunit ScpB [Alphaproteobacteria bacterium]
MSDSDPTYLRLVEALLFAANHPLDRKAITARLPDDVDVDALLHELEIQYADRGVNLVKIGSSWAFRTAPDLGTQLKLEVEVPRKLSRAAIETLAIIAYHQPVTRAEIEEVRGVALSKGTLENLLEAGWISPGRRRQTPGRPVTWVTTEAFLGHFGLATLEDLPGVDELKAAGLLDPRPTIATIAMTDAERIQSEGDQADILEEDLPTPLLDLIEDGEEKQESEVSEEVSAAEELDNEEEYPTAEIIDLDEVGARKRGR